MKFQQMKSAIYSFGKKKFRRKRKKTSFAGKKTPQKTLSLEDKFGEANVICGIATMWPIDGPFDSGFRKKNNLYGASIGTGS